MRRARGTAAVKRKNRVLSAELESNKAQLKKAVASLAAAEAHAKTTAHKLLSLKRTSSAAAMTAASAKKSMRAQLTEIKDVLEETKAAKQEAEESVKGAEAAAQQANAESEAAAKALAASKTAHEDLNISIGLNKGYATVPAPSFTGDASKEHAAASREKRLAKVVKASVGERMQSAEQGVRSVAKGMAASTDIAGHRALLDTPEFASVQKEVVVEALQKQEEQWSSRLSVHISVGSVLGAAISL
eukprot:3791616-Pleurochrysis_carterae.AAC.1